LNSGVWKLTVAWPEVPNSPPMEELLEELLLAPLEPARADLTAAEILGWRLLTTEVTMAPWPAPLREKEFWPKLDTEGPKLWGAGRV